MKLRDFLRYVSSEQKFEVFNDISCKKYNWVHVIEHVDELQVVAVEAADNTLAIYVQ